MIQLIRHGVIYRFMFYTFIILLIENQWFYFFSITRAYGERNCCSSVTVGTAVVASI